MPDDPDLRPRLEFALEAAEAAGRATLRWFEQEDLAVERKADNSPVTAADREAEQVLRRRIEEAFPHDAIFGEEYGERPGRTAYRWILDPIDGTKSFIHGVPLYGTLVGLERDGEGVLGVIGLPALDEWVYAARGGGAWRRRGGGRPKPARVSRTERLDQSLLVTSEVQTFGDRGAEEAYRRFERQCRLVRTWGDCYGYALVATGRAEVMIDPVMHLWDAAAVQPVVEEAGGVFADWSGRRTIHSGEGIGACPGVLDQVLDVTRSFVRIR